MNRPHSLTLRQEIDVLLSSACPSVLLPALPVAFLTEQLGIIPPQLIQAGTTSSQSPVTKVFWPDHLEEIKSEFEGVKLLGSAAAEEWLKGLEIRGKRALADASRWEKWDLSRGVYQMQIATPWVLPLPDEPETPIQLGIPIPFQPLPPKPPQADQVQDQNQPAPSTKHGIPGLTTSSLQLRTQGQQKRTKDEVLELKAKRRAEIERRALLLDPPLTPDVLAHIPSFQAALQIITHLDDNAWELLRPRILTQRKDAESRVEQNIASARAVQDRLSSAKAEVNGDAESKEVTDADWDEIQGPLRARISDYSDETIRDGWEEGEKVTKKNAAQFAVEVLLYVRKRFYAEVAKDAAAALAAGKTPIVDPPQGPWTQKLTLENMKWVFDFKIKPHTERLKVKELFRCNGCQGNYKYYAFEAVIQHYAAKHTSALSSGSVVVHWRAEWPVEPPFCPDSKIPTSSQPVQPPHSQPLTYQSTTGSEHQHSYPGFAHDPTAAYSATGYGAQMPYYGYGQQSYYGAAASYPYAAYAAYAGYGTQPYDYNAQYYPYAATPVQPTTNTSLPPPPGLTHDSNANTQQATYASNPEPSQQVNNGAPSKKDKTQLKAMIRIAAEAWSKVSNIRDKDLPASIKVCVVIHYIAKEFEEEFSEPPHLGMFIESLSPKTTRAIRNVNNALRCKACVEKGDDKCKKMKFSLPQLAKHFLKSHVDAMTANGIPPLDWRIDMMQLPEVPALRRLRGSLQNKPSAYAAVSDTIPWAFNNTLDHTNQEDDQPYVFKTESLAHPTREVERPRDAGPTSRGTPTIPQSYSASLLDPPNLRPASAVYGMEKTARESLRSRSPRPAHGRDLSPHPNSHPSSTVYPMNGSSGPRERNEPLPRYLDEDHRRPGSADLGQTNPYGMDMNRERYDDNNSRHLGDHQEDSHEGRSTRRWERDYRPERTANKPIPRSTGAHQDGGYGLMGALESHLDRGRDNVMYVDPSGRELRKTADGTFVYRDDPMAEPLRRPASPRYDPYPPSRHQERGPPPRYPQQYREDEYPRERAYYDSRPAPPPEEGYELVEVRDPQGAYFIKRPIQRDYPYEARAPLRDVDSRPAYRSGNEQPPAHDMGHASYPRGPAMATRQPQPGPEFEEEYDPRYPAAGGRRDVHRYGG